LLLDQIADREQILGVAFAMNADPAVGVPPSWREGGRVFGISRIKQGERAKRGRKVAHAGFPA
jgi:hypothetical protein